MDQPCRNLFDQVELAVRIAKDIHGARMTLGAPSYWGGQYGTDVVPKWHSFDDRMALYISRISILVE